MLSTPVAGALGGLLAAATVVALAAALGDAGALAAVRARATDDGSALGVGVAAYLAYGVVAGGAFGALAAWFGVADATPPTWLLRGVAWGVALFLVGVGYRVAVGSGDAAIPLRRALGYDLVFGVVVGGVVGALV